MEGIDRIKGFLNGSNLKRIAAVSMLIDHVGYLLLGCGVLWMLPKASSQYEVWYQIYQTLRSVGRMAFPIYAFLLTEGIVYTRNWKRYGLRLGIFAFLSEIPFDLMCFQKPLSGDGQNVFFTLWIGLMTVKAAEYIADRMTEETFMYHGIPEWVLSIRCQIFTGRRLLVWSGAAGIGCIAAAFLKTDYDYTGVMLIVVLYLLREDRMRQCMGGFFWLLLSLKRWYHMWGLAAAFILIGLYNGERGSRKGKYAFYAFYPIHMLMLYLVYQWMMKNIGSLPGFLS